jgi:ribonuclease J
MKDDKINTLYSDGSLSDIKNVQETDTTNGAPMVKVIKLGSDVGATKNMYVYECEDDIIIVDCGIGFPDSELLGVDVVIPDITYLLERKHKLRGLFITHAHDDHIGAVPYLIGELQTPIYANKLVQGFIKERLKERYPNGGGVSFNLISPDSGPVTLGHFTVEAFGVNHSVPEGMGYAIKTPQGTILHIADYKIDWTPVLDKPIQLGRIADYGEKGVICLLSDCLGVTVDGYTKSERTLDETFDHFFEKSPGRQIFVTTISSNISRMYQIAKAAIHHGRKVVFSGRSIDQSSTVARNLGYLPFNDSDFISEKESAKYPQDQLVYIIPGCYGQQGSGLDRLARGEHTHITMQDNALVIFSADPFPGVEEAVEKLLHNLTVGGAEVIYSEIQDNLHVSGHGLKGDLMTVSALSKAKYYIPIGGTAAKMRAYTNMIISLGKDKKNVFELLEGESVEFSHEKAKRGAKVEVKPVYLDGRNMSELSPIVVKDRETLSVEGVFVVVIPVNRDGKIFADKVEIVTRGFIYVKGSQELMDKSKKFVTGKLNKSISNDGDWMTYRKKLEREIERFLYKETGRSPLVIAHSIEI